MKTWFGNPAQSPDFNPSEHLYDGPEHRTAPQISSTSQHRCLTSLALWNIPSGVTEASWTYRWIYGARFTTRILKNLNQAYHVMFGTFDSFTEPFLFVMFLWPRYFHKALSIGSMWCFLMEGLLSLRSRVSLKSKAAATHRYQITVYNENILVLLKVHSDSTNKGSFIDLILPNPFNQDPTHPRSVKG